MGYWFFDNGWNGKKFRNVEDILAFAKNEYNPDYLEAVYDFIAETYDASEIFHDWIHDESPNAYFRIFDNEFVRRYADYEGEDIEIGNIVFEWMDDGPIIVSGSRKKKTPAKKKTAAKKTTRRK